MRVSMLTVTLERPPLPAFSGTPVSRTGATTRRKGTWMFRIGRSTTITALAVTLSAALGLSACAPGGGSAPSTAQPTGPVATDPATMGKVQLHILDYFSGGVDNAWMTAVVNAFHHKYPNITIKRTSQGWGDVMQELPLKLKSNNPPDIVPANNGWQSLGALVQGGLVLNLDKYAAAYGWRTRIPQSILREHEFSADGRQMGTGSMFGTPVARASLIEVYYNRDLLKKIHATVPTTYAQFQADLAKAKAAGITPICLGNSDQAGITEPLYSVMDAYGPQSKISDLIYSRGKVPFSASGFPQAVKTLKSWSDKGYLTKDYAGVQSQDAAQAFVNGKGLFHFDYSGSLPLSAGQGHNLGSFLMPRADGGPAVATASSATNFSISAKSKHAAAAAAFLNFAASPVAAKLAVDHATMPLLDPSLKAPAGNPLFADDVANAARLSEHDTSVPYLDWATPTLLNTVNTKMQDLLAGKTTASDVVQAVQKDDDTFTATLK